MENPRMQAAVLAAHYPVVIVGGGQAGLCTSHYLKLQGVAHVVLEKHRVAHAWRNDRWDSFCLVTPNWQCRLPGWDYSGNDPHGFMKKDKIIDYLAGYIRHERPVSIAAWVDETTYHRVLGAARQTGGTRLKPIFLALGEAIGYETIRLVVAHAAGQSNER